jgi:uncharacterized RDD family membrane protein YckC
MHNNDTINGTVITSGTIITYNNNFYEFIVLRIIMAGLLLTIFIFSLYTMCLTIHKKNHNKVNNHSS